MGYTPTAADGVGSRLPEWHAAVDTTRVMLDGDTIKYKCNVLIMASKSLYIVIILFTYCILPYNADPQSQTEDAVPVVSQQNLQKPTVFVAVLVRNKAHSLPYTLRYLEDLDYPKDRMIIWLRSDHSIDNSRGITNSWVRKVTGLYHGVSFKYQNEGIGYEDENGSCHWTKKRFENVIALRQKALDTARKKWADYLFMVDADVVLYNKNVLNELIAQDKPIIAPLLNVTASKYYSNFWGEMSDDGYYKRSEDYYAIVERRILGCFPVSMVHSALLVNLKLENSKHLSYASPMPDYKGPFDDIIQFAISARETGMQMYIYNPKFYGYVPQPMEKQNDLMQEREQFSHIVIHSIICDKPLEKLESINIVREPENMGFDQIYMINLKRRPERRVKMEKCFTELGIDYKIFDAVDGRQLNTSYLKSLGVKMLPGFEDPYGKRPLTMGEVGCFLSHYKIWQDVIKNKYQKIIVFEDDIRFEPYFKTKLEWALKDVEKLNLEWELIYVGRKRLNAAVEEWIDGTERIVIPHYSYWTLSYMLTYNGAEKLLKQNPLNKMVPVDEYLPIMFDRHLTEEWKTAFSPRDLKAFSVEPLLVYPTLYTGEPGYFTDTERSDLIDVKELAATKDEL